jgi:hypothetical protein
VWCHHDDGCEDHAQEAGRNRPRLARDLAARHAGAEEARMIKGRGVVWPVFVGVALALLALPFTWLWKHVLGKTR